VEVLLAKGLASEVIERVAARLDRSLGRGCRLIVIVISPHLREADDCILNETVRAEVVAYAEILV